MEGQTKRKGWRREERMNEGRGDKGLGEERKREGERFGRGEG